MPEFLMNKKVQQNMNAPSERVSFIFAYSDLGILDLGHVQSNCLI